MTTIAFAHLGPCSGPEARNLDKQAASPAIWHGTGSIGA